MGFSFSPPSLTWKGYSRLAGAQTKAGSGGISPVRAVGSGGAATRVLTPFPRTLSPGTPGAGPHAAAPAGLSKGPGRGIVHMCFSLEQQRNCLWNRSRKSKTHSRKTHTSLELRCRSPCDGHPRGAPGPSLLSASPPPRGSAPLGTTGCSVGRG